MDTNFIKNLLEEIAGGKKTVDEALERLRDFPMAELDVAKYDSHRVLRNGFSEVVLCEGKKTEHLLQIFKGMNEKGINIFGTRADEETGKTIKEVFSKAVYDSVSRTVSIINRAIIPVVGRISIICAGTADMPVAEEARKTAGFFGVEARKFYDVGVAGLHRLINILEPVRESGAVIVVAGMEGALPSVVGGLVSCPVIAVPTSVGYGANFGGITPLLAMLNSCSEGITVVNIDNGFGAACAALRILKKNAG